MCARNDNHNGPRKWSVIAFFGTILLSCGLGQAQTPFPLRSDYYGFGRDFLRSLYPQLNDKHHTMTIESSLAYDDQAGQPRWFRLSVGDGPKFAVLGCCLSSSSRGIITAPQTPLPPPPGAHPAAPVPQQAQPQFKRPEEWGAEGAIYPKQYLTTGFSFDEKGRLTGFTAEGSAINDNVADNQIYELVHGHPEMTEAQVVAALKQAGIKYGPDDKEQFTKDLPLQKLQRFLGPLELVSVNFHPLDRTRSWLGSWPDWTVDVLATQQDGTKLRYHMIFDHLKGDLIGLFIVPTSPSKPAEGRK